MKRAGYTFIFPWLFIYPLFKKRTVPLGENSCKRNYFIDGKHSTEILIVQTCKILMTGKIVHTFCFTKLTQRFGFNRNHLGMVSVKVIIFFHMHMENQRADEFMNRSLFFPQTEIQNTSRQASILCEGFGSLTSFLSSKIQ